eukprot:91276_1
MEASLNPLCLSECSAQTIVSIINREMIPKIPLLRPYKTAIEAYFTTNNIDGKAFLKMKRNKFVKGLSAATGNKKTKSSATALYLKIKKYSVRVEDCSWLQICHLITNYILPSLSNPRLNENKDAIIKYITQHALDGAIILGMRRRHFGRAFAEYVNNKTLTGAAMKLHKAIVGCDTSTITNYTKSKRQQSEATMHHVVKVQSIGIPPTDAPPANDSHKSKQSNLLSPDVDSMGWSQLKERCGMEGLSPLGTKKQLLFSLRQKLYPNKDNDSDSNGLEKKKKNKKGSQTGALKQEKSANKLKPALSKQVKRSTASDTDQSEDEEDDATESESNASDGAHHTPIDATNDRSLSHISNSSDNDGDD